MAMQVDEAGRHQFAGGVEHAQRARLGDVGFHRLDHAVADADVAFAAQRLAGVEHIAALDQEVEFVVRPHGGARAARRQSQCSGREQKIAT